MLERTGVREAVLIGQSDGASIALAYAGAFPERVRGVIAMSPHLFLEARSRESIGRQIADFERGDLKARLRRHHGSRTEALFERLVEVWTAERARRELRARAARRARALPGARDPGGGRRILLRRPARGAGAACCPERVETLRIPGAAHYPMHQARNEVLAASIRFVRAALGSAPTMHACG